MNFPAERTDDFLRIIDESVNIEADRNDAAQCTLDLYFLAYLRRMSRFGFFNFGPITLDLRLIEDIVDRMIVKRNESFTGRPPMSDDFVRFSQILATELRRSGRRHFDEMHFLLAFMRAGEGLPQRVFGELGVTPEQIEEYAKNGGGSQPVLEKLFSPEEAAEYLNIHVQTVRAWIRTGRLRARRLAGQRALRITASDLQSVLEPLEANGASQAVLED
jgi:excisionase family DNA binding protein